MERNKLNEMLRKIYRKRTIRRIVALLSVVILLSTANTLKMSADTLERIAACGMAEHTHAEECYDGAGALICGLGEHVHTDACFQQRPVAEQTLSLEDIPGEDISVGEGSEYSSEDEVASQDVETPAEEIDVELGTPDGEQAAEDAEAVGAEDPHPQAEDKPGDKLFSLRDREFALASEIASAAGIDIALVSDIGAVSEDDEEPVIGIEAIDGDWVIYAARDFEEAELALVTEEGVETVKLTDGYAIGAQDPEPIELAEDEQAAAPEGEAPDGTERARAAASTAGIPE